MFKKLLDRIKGSPTLQMAIPANEEQMALMVAVGNRERRKAYLLKNKADTTAALLSWCRANGKI